jgi:hypothetical protein
MKCRTQNNSRCGSAKVGKPPDKAEWDDLISHYKENYQTNADVEKLWFSQADDLEDAIKKAVRSEFDIIISRSPDVIYYMASHQTRIGRENLRKATGYFLESTKLYASCKTFSELISITETVSTPKKLRIGPLTRYDISSRIAGYLRLKIDDVYLHAGTKIGARKLGIKAKKKISRDELVAHFPQLRCFDAEDIENFLCIYKDRLPPPK